MHFPQSLSSHLSREKKAYSVGLHGPSILFNASFSFVTGRKREELLKSFTSVICVKVCLFHRSENHASLRFSIKVWWLEEHERMLIPNGTSSCPAPLLLLLLLSRLHDAAKWVFFGTLCSSEMSRDREKNQGRMHFTFKSRPLTE